MPLFDDLFPDVEPLPTVENASARPDDPVPAELLPEPAESVEDPEAYDDLIVASFARSAEILDRLGIAPSGA